MAILAWLDEHQTCPCTKAPLSKEQLIPNRALKDTIEKWKEVMEHLCVEVRQLVEATAAIERARADSERTRADSDRATEEFDLAAAEREQRKSELSALVEKQKQEREALEKVAKVAKED